MKIINFNQISNIIKLVPESYDDLYLLAIILNQNDKIGAHTYRRFKSSETDTGEQKEVFVKIQLEKIEIDKSAWRLRLTGKILDGKPLEYVHLNTYHTLNIGTSDLIEIEKLEWKDYILKRLKQAVLDAKKPKLAIIVFDDEKATLAYIRGYGIDIITELYSKLSKKISEKDFEKLKINYFEGLIKLIQGLDVNIVILAGPGFTKDDFKKYLNKNNMKLEKKLFFESCSDAERSGIREVLQSETISKIFENEHVKKEFEYLNMFLSSLRIGDSISGVEKVSNALNSYSIGIILVNDSVIWEDEIKELLDNADKQGVIIEIFNSEDEAGKQLSSFKNIVGLSKYLLK
ncbi:MAG: mRNA surveillance protein pelota [Candidatus Micrarchaeaceae archaeon]